MNKRFPKSEKLKNFKTIESLFLDGKTHSKYPIKVFFLPKPKPKLKGEEEKSNTNMAAFAVPKRKFKLAVDRNRVKRQLRECYRLNKHIIKEDNDQNLVMLFLYLGKSKPKYAVLEKAMVDLLNKLNTQRSFNY